jgi:hypothetical protein
MTANTRPDRRSRVSFPRTFLQLERSFALRHPYHARSQPPSIKRQVTGSKNYARVIYRSNASVYGMAWRLFHGMVASGRCRPC